MSSTNVFSVICGMIAGLSFMLIFHRRFRTKLAASWPWIAEHPRAYPLLVAASAVLILLVAYVISVRFA
jgi:hypothetical protein